MKFENDLKFEDIKILLLLIITAAAVWYLNYVVHFNGFFWSDSHDYNQMARNLFEGKGFSTSVLRPISFLDYKILPHPEYTRPPLYPYCLAAAYHIFGVNDTAVAVVNGFFYVCFVAATFFFCRQFSGSALTALAVTATAGLSSWFLSMSIMGSTDIVFAALFMIFLYFYMKLPQKPFFIGLLTGILYITRWNAVFIAAAIVLTEYNPIFQWRRWKKTAAFGAGVILTASPVLLRNMFLQGAAMSSINSAGFISGGESLPGYFYIAQLTPVSVWEFIRTHPWEIFYADISKFRMLLEDFPADYGVPMLMLMLGGAFVTFRQDNRLRVKRLIIITALIQTVMLVLTNAEPRYYGFLVPALVLFVFDFFKQRQSARIEYIAYVLCFLLVVASSAGFWKTGKTDNRYKILAGEIKAETAKDDVIISDMAWAISWYGDRRTVWLTYDPASLDVISKAIPIKYAFISLETVYHPLLRYKDKVWQNLLLNRGTYTVPGFSFVKMLYVNNYPVGALYRIGPAN